MIANAGKLNNNSNRAAVKRKNKQNLFSFQFNDLNFKENICTPAINKYDDNRINKRIQI